MIRLAIFLGIFLIIRILLDALFSWSGLEVLAWSFVVSVFVLVLGSCVFSFLSKRKKKKQDLLTQKEARKKILHKDKWEPISWWDTSDQSRQEWLQKIRKEMRHEK